VLTVRLHVSVGPLTPRRRSAGDEPPAQGRAGGPPQGRLLAQHLRDVRSRNLQPREQTSRHRDSDRLIGRHVSKPDRHGLPRCAPQLVEQLGVRRALTRPANANTASLSTVCRNAAAMMRWSWTARRCPCGCGRGDRSLRWQCGQSTRRPRPYGLYTPRVEEAAKVPTGLTTTVVALDARRVRAAEDLP